MPEWYRIDLISFHRRLRTLILIDSKFGNFTHTDASQMNLYLNYACEHWVHENKSQPVCLILRSRSDDVAAYYALGNLSHTVLAREYQLNLLSEEH